jgi:hypothetical protein
VLSSACDEHIVSARGTQKCSIGIESLVRECRNRATAELVDSFAGSTKSLE